MPSFRTLTDVRVRHCPRCLSDDNQPPAHPPVRN
jgi:hypothetical protein